MTPKNENNSENSLVWVQMDNLSSQVAMQEIRIKNLEKEITMLRERIAMRKRAGGGEL